MVLSYIISKKAFLLFQKMKISSSKFRKFQDGTFVARKAKKTHSEKSSYYFREWKTKKLLFFSEKNLLYFMRELAKSQKQRFPYFGKWNFLALRLKNSHIFSKK